MGGSMTQFKTKEEAGRFALEHGFKWKAGCINTKGAMVIKEVDDQLVVVMDDPDEDNDIPLPYYFKCSIKDMGIPDFDDDATMGCLRAQVQEKWGERFHTIPFLDNVWAGFVHEDSVGEGPTERAALLNALAEVG